ncbi:ABC transporter ATP-binding protein [Pseudonocardia kunmingensis]|uniref:Branched-chain amino acid transport system ATP-binding protein n=1 Tax=Pseudonocardia kunmingensis TaxID=630975 RepID=A0A543DVJ9_9PSEU|nr:ABC transporter ATP-binding protein [Pseudonocardia kunmingensis]TQM13352.1 branched-chain amino acid transport system ATP-binding protein [Pseudonocardia kunmingensis]
MTTADESAARIRAASATMEPALTCEGVSARYGRIEVCRNISLTVAEREVVTVLGPNGAGKSSLLGALGGQVRGGGAIRVGGHRIEALPAHRRAAAGLALVPEGRGNCFGSLTVRENLLLGARLAPRNERDTVYAEVLDLFPSLRSRLSQPASALSGGEQQMLAIGMALAGRPKLLALDEPSQGLAPTILRDLTRLFALLRGRGIGLLIAEQNHAFAAAMADRFVVIVGGELVAEGTRDELRRDVIAAAYLSKDGERS